jgi:four helix bundle protein
LDEQLFSAEADVIMERGSNYGDVPFMYRRLKVWQRAVELVNHIYACTELFPKHELYGLANQLRRASVSVPSNIAEGQGRMTEGECRQFLGNARGSLHEVDTQVYIAGDIVTSRQNRLRGLIA